MATDSELLQACRAVQEAMIAASVAGNIEAESAKKYNDACHEAYDARAKLSDARQRLMSLLGDIAVPEIAPACGREFI